METEEIWSTISEEIIEKYSTFLNIGIQIAILSLAGFFFILIFIIFAGIWFFDKSIKCSPATSYSIRFDPKGFSNNELRLYNVKSVMNGGCRLPNIQKTQKGKAGILQTEKMFDPPFPKFDVLLQPWFTEIPATSIFHIVEWHDYFENPVESSDVPGTGESVGGLLNPAITAAEAAAINKTPPPSNNDNNVAEQQQKQKPPKDKPLSDADKKNKNVAAPSSSPEKLQQQPSAPAPTPASNKEKNKNVAAPSSSPEKLQQPSAPPPAPANKEKNNKNVPAKKQPPSTESKPIKISSKEIVEKSSNPTNRDSKKAKEAADTPPPQQRTPAPITPSTPSPFSTPTPKRSETPQATPAATPPANVETLGNIAKKNSRRSPDSLKSL